jgi:hypothetical protein
MGVGLKGTCCQICVLVQVRVVPVCVCACARAFVHVHVHVRGCVSVCTRRSCVCLHTDVRACVCACIAQCLCACAECARVCEELAAWQPCAHAITTRMHSHTHTLSVRGFARARTRLPSAQCPRAFLFLDPHLPLAKNVVTSRWHLGESRTRQSSRYLARWETACS